jgi:hypothetical protein
VSLYAGLVGRFGTMPWVGTLPNLVKSPMHSQDGHLRSSATSSSHPNLFGLRMA